MYIIFEGPDGSGKSTHIKLICEYLESFGKKVFIRREPGGTYFAEKIRDLILNDPKSREMNLITQEYLVLANYVEGLLHIKELILDGYIVLSDRSSIYSSQIYQGDLGNHKSPITSKQVYDLHFEARQLCEIQEPDMIIGFLPTLDETIRRVQNEKRKSGNNYLDEVTQGFINRYNGYQELFKTLEKEIPERFVLVDGDNSQDETYQKVKSVFQKIFKLS